MESSASAKASADKEAGKDKKPDKSEERVKVWQGRFSKKTDKLVEEFASSLPFDKRLHPQDIRGSIAHATMLAKAKIISLEEADQIIAGLQEIFREIEAGKFKFKPEDEDIHTAIERGLIEKIGPVGGKLHTARSRNDQVVTDLRLYLKEEILEIWKLLKELQQVLLELGKKNLKVIMPGFTHFQPAQPLLFSHYLLAYFFMFGRDFTRLKCSYKRTDVLPLGSGALAGTSFPIERQFVAEQLGFSKFFENALDAVSDRDFVVEFLSAATLVMVHLSRFSEELILWSNPQFDFIELDEAYTTGSSIMPQKKNPDVLELIRGKTGRVIGHLTAMLTTLKALPLAYNRDLQEDKEGLFDTVDTLKNSLKVFSGLLSTLKINEDEMREAASKGFTLATDIADYLTKKGLPFREAHQSVGKLTKHCLSKKANFSDLNLKDYQKFSPLFEKDLFELLDLKRSVESKISPGGTAPSQVQNQLQQAKEILTEQETWLAKVG